MDENLIVMPGEDPEECRRERVLRRRIDADSQKYIGVPVSEWPRIIFNWDLSKQSQRFSKDGVSPEEFNRSYPQGFCLGYVSLADLDKRLCVFSRRKDREVWAIGDPFKLAYLIVYLSEGRPISPPLATPLAVNEIVMDGGHHRYAIATALGEPEIPVYVTPRHRGDLESLVKVRWVEN